MELSKENPFQSFWMAGYECTDQLNSAGNRVDFLHITDHFNQLDADYKLAGHFNLKTVREGMRWSQVEKRPYSYDFSTVKIMLEHGKKNNIQQIWDICHFGYPDDLTPLHPHFSDRFAAVCGAFAKFHKSECPDDVLIVTPINEVSFISWLGGQVGATSPYCTNHGWEVKYALMKAYIKGIYAMKQVYPEVRILTTEPLVNIVPPLFATEQELEEAAAANQQQFQSLDMLGGYICPELGGSPELIDLIGFNYYYNNQFIYNSQFINGVCNFLPWVNEDNDPRWKPLSELIAAAYERYQRPVVIAETSHPTEDRPKWINFIGKECQKLLAQGVPLLGVCLYPILDRPDWDNLSHWHQSGLWDKGPENERVLCIPYAYALMKVQDALTAIYTNVDSAKYDVVASIL